LPAGWLTPSPTVFRFGQVPYLGRTRDHDIGPDARNFAVGEYVILYCVDDGDVLILRVVHGKRVLEALFGR